MIWVRGRVVPDDALSIRIADRVFEHGLGLFETFRTWQGRAALLPRHLARLTTCAARLGIPLEPDQLPDDSAVSALRSAELATGDSAFRLVLTGGDERFGSTLWMRAQPLPPAPNRGLVLGTIWTVEPSDPVTRMKSINYWSRRSAFEAARVHGHDEALLATPDGRIWEGSRTNLFVVRDARLITPPTDGPLLPGIMRGLVIETAAQCDIATEEIQCDLDDLRNSDEVFLTNSLRGLQHVATLRFSNGEDARFSLEPGLVTRKLRDAVQRKLESSEVSP